MLKSFEHFHSLLMGPNYAVHTNMEPRKTIGSTKSIFELANAHGAAIFADDVSLLPYYDLG